jgi:RND superfamily putative drug exporter
MLRRWTTLVIRHRGLVVGAWLALAIVGAFASTGLSALLSTSLSVPGTDSARADAILTSKFHQNVEGTFTVVLPFKTASTSQLAGYVVRLDKAVRSIPTATVTEHKAVGGVFYANVTTGFNLKDAAAKTDTLRAALAAQGLRGALVTGPPAIEHDITPVLASDLRRGELMAVVLALLLLVLVLGLCWAVLVPFLVAGATIAASIGVIYLLAHHYLMVLYIPNVVELVGLGLAIDYSLLIVHRFRREVSVEDVSVDDAVLVTMATAGRTVVLSGCTVAIGLATLFLVPVPFVRSLGMAGLVVPIIAVGAALTLQPAMLSYLGRQGVAPIGARGLLFTRAPSDGMWARVARRAVARPVSVLVSATIALAVFIIAIGWLQLTPGSTTAVPANLPSTRALTIVSNRVGSAFATPNQVVIDLGGAHRATTARVRAETLRLAETFLHTAGVFAVAIDTKPPFVDPTGRYEQIYVIGQFEFGAVQSQALVRELRTRDVPLAHFGPGTHVYVGGAPAQGVDFLNAVYGSFPWIILVALILAYLVLARAFRSLILPLLAAAFDLVSVAVSYGALVIFFRWGVAQALLGTYRVRQIEGWVPVFIFAMLFGLTMDYEVFIVARTREARLHGATNNEAIIEGLANTGGVVTGAAVILVSALSGLIFGHVAGLQELGVGLAIGVLIDATIVRGLLLPSAMALLGSWCWWWPASMTRTTAGQTILSGDAALE